VAEEGQFSEAMLLGGTGSGKQGASARRRKRRVREKPKKILVSGFKVDGSNHAKFKSATKKLARSLALDILGLFDHCHPSSSMEESRHLKLGSAILCDFCGVYLFLPFFVDFTP
jgi:hypothetical protein